jgi:hypothetical protein
VIEAGKSEALQQNQQGQLRLQKARSPAAPRASRFASCAALKKLPTANEQHSFRLAALSPNMRYSHHQDDGSPFCLLLSRALAPASVWRHERLIKAEIGKKKKKEK